MAKNFFIFTLLLLCFAMLYALAGKTGGLGNNINMAKGKIPHAQLIKSATVQGLSLETPVQKIDEILARAPFECRTNEREHIAEDKKTSQEKFWTCSHNTLQGAELRVHVIDNAIQSITRTGPGTKEDIYKTIADLDVLKSKMESLEGFNMSQSESSTIFHIRHKLDNDKITSMSYRMQILPIRDPENPPPHEGMLSVSLVR